MPRPNLVGNVGDATQGPQDPRTRCYLKQVQKKRRTIYEWIRDQLMQEKDNIWRVLLLMYHTAMARGVGQFRVYLRKPKRGTMLAILGTMIDKTLRAECPMVPELLPVHDRGHSVEAAKSFLKRKDKEHSSKPAKLSEIHWTEFHERPPHKPNRRGPHTHSERAIALMAQTMHQQ